MYENQPFTFSLPTYSSYINPITNPTMTMNSSLNSNNISLPLQPDFDIVMNQEDYINESNWLTSSFIDWILKFYALQHSHVTYLSCDFVPLHLFNDHEKISQCQCPCPSTTTSIEMDIDTDNSNHCKLHNQHIVDILGQPLNPQSRDKSIVFFYNRNNIHWNLIRIQFQPNIELQIFEPMGQSNRRTCTIRKQQQQQQQSQQQNNSSAGNTNDGVNTGNGITNSMNSNDSIRNYRYIPKCIIDFLNLFYPLQNKKTSWLDYAKHMITKQQQYSSYDCGIACLLYAIKCGNGETIHEINQSVTQATITLYRQELQKMQNEWITPPSSPPMMPTHDIKNNYDKKIKKKEYNQEEERIDEDEITLTKRKNNKKREQITVRRNIEENNTLSRKKKQKKIVEIPPEIVI